MQIKEENSHFALYNDENQEIGEMTWSDADEGMMTIDHTFIDPTYCGQKLTEKLVLADVEKAREEHKKIIPLYSFAKKEFNTKPGYEDVLGK